jgi:hypothetical protein
LEQHATNLARLVLTRRNQIPAQADMLYEFFPVPIYYVMQRDETQGFTTVAHAGSLSPVEINFVAGDGVGRFNAVVTVNADNVYSVKYM